MDQAAHLDQERLPRPVCARPLIGLAARRGSRGGERGRASERESAGHGVTVCRRRGGHHSDAKQQRWERAPSQGRVHGHPEGPEADAQDRLRHEKIGKPFPTYAHLLSLKIGG